MERYLTHSEVQMLTPIFKNTLPYGSIVCAINDANIGGPGNSITPAGRAYFSSFVYCPDFSHAHTNEQWVFIHEMVHVWQWGHGIFPVNAAIGLYLRTAGKYESSYPYDLKAGKNLADFNIEQQASIVADYWALQSAKLAPRNNNDPRATVADYSALITQLQKSGPSIRKLAQIQL